MQCNVSVLTTCLLVPVDNMKTIEAFSAFSVATTRIARKFSHVEQRKLTLTARTMNTKESFLQKVFYEISLEKDPKLWQDDQDSRQKNAERIKFLSGFEQTRYKAQLDRSKSSTRKNDVLAKALKEKGNKEYSGGDSVAALILYNQALCYSSQEGEYSTILGNRSALWADLGKHSLVLRDVTQALQ